MMIGERNERDAIKVIELMLSNGPKLFKELQQMNVKNLNFLCLGPFSL